ncbi:MAG TPA: anti-sigma factor [Tepidisphaeraceae bacterium]|jgi:hypothetical protein
MSLEPTHFEDPGLKRALQSVQSGMKAPPHLRERILAQLRARGSRQSVAASATDAVRIGPRPSNARKFALAAAILLCFGGGILLFIVQLRPERHVQEYPRNDAVIDSMVDLQTALAGGKEVGAALSPALSDLAALSSAATEKLGRAVPVVDLSKDGWRLTSATLCDVDQHASVQFHFVHDGDKSMTVFSMPASAWAGAREGSRYDLVDNDHALAGYVHGGSLNCLIGDSSVTREEAIELRDRIEQQQQKGG